MKTYVQTAIIGAVWTLCAVNPMMAQEAPSPQEFNRVVEEINKTLNRATARVAESRQRLEQTAPFDIEKLLPVQRAAIDDLADASSEFERDKNPEAEKRVQQALLSYTRVNSNIIQGTGNALNEMIVVVGELSESFSKVVANMGELEGMTAHMTGKASEDQKKQLVETKRQALGALNVLDALERFEAGDEELKEIRGTLSVIVDSMYEHNADLASLSDNLSYQRKQLQRAVAQLDNAKRRLESQKAFLHRIALMRVAETMLMKAAHVLLGSVTIQDIGAQVNEQVDKNWKHLNTFSKAGNLGQMLGRKRSETSNHSAGLDKLRSDPALAAR